MGYTRLAEHLYVHHGAINVGILREGPRALLIDYGEGDVRETLDALGVRQVETVLLTHHHRDQASGLGPPVASGTRVCVPALERAWVEEVEALWNDPAQRWHLYDFRPNHVLAQANNTPRTANTTAMLSICAALSDVLSGSAPSHTNIKQYRRPTMTPPIQPPSNSLAILIPITP